MFASGAFSSDPQEPLAGRCRRACEFLAWPTSNAACRSRTAIRWSASKAAPICCAALAGWWRRSRMSSAACDTPRPGGLFDRLAMLADGRQLPAPTILSELLQQLGPIWPSRLTLGGIALGDCWKHPLLTTADATSGLVPLHKLSQWLAYSLIEPLQNAGIEVTDIDGLTGLAEYRNGGLFVDTGVLTFRDPDDAAARARCGVTAGRGMARADGGVARPRRRRSAAAAWARCHVAAAGENSRRRNLGGGSAAGARAPRRRRRRR